MERKQKSIMPGELVHAFNTSTQEAETDSSLWVQGQPGLHCLKKHTQLKNPTEQINTNPIMSHTILCLWNCTHFPKPSLNTLFSTIPSLISHTDRIKCFSPLLFQIPNFSFSLFSVHHNHLGVRSGPCIYSSVPWYLRVQTGPCFHPFVPWCFGVLPGPWVLPTENTH